MNKSTNGKLTIMTLFYCIQALDQYIVSHINRMNAMVKGDSEYPNMSAMLVHLYRVEQELELAYEEELKSVSNYPPYEQLISVHPEVI